MSDEQNVGAEQQNLDTSNDTAGTNTANPAGNVPAGEEAAPVTDQPGQDSAAV